MTKKLEINTITIKLWSGNEFGVYVKNEDATVKEIVDAYLEISPNCVRSDIERVSVIFVGDQERSEVLDIWRRVKGKAEKAEAELKVTQKKQLQSNIELCEIEKRISGLYPDLWEEIKNL